VDLSPFLFPWELYKLALIRKRCDLVEHKADYFIHSLHNIPFNKKGMPRWTSPKRKTHNNIAAVVGGFVVYTLIIDR
jgi:hypothetical protein